MKRIAFLSLAAVQHALFATLFAAPAKAEPAVKAEPPVANAGLSVSVVLAKAKFTQSEAVKFTITFKNSSDKAIMLYDIRWPSYSITVDDRWSAGMAPGPAIARVPPRPDDSVALAPGKSISFDFDMAGRGYWEKDPVNRDSMINRIDQLPAGKHRLLIERTLGMNPAPGNYPHAHWTGAIKHKPAEFEIAGPAK